MFGRGIRIARCLVGRVESRRVVARGVSPRTPYVFDQLKQELRSHRVFCPFSSSHHQEACFSTRIDSDEKSEEEDSYSVEDNGEGSAQERLSRAEYNEQYKIAAKKQLDYLKRDVGLGSKIRKRCRNLDQTTVKAMKPKIQFFRDELSITQEEFKILFKYGGLGRVLHFDGEEDVVERVKYLFNLFNNDKQVVRSMLLRFPAILAEPIESKVKPKIDYLQREVFAADPTQLPMALKKIPQLLLGSYSLEAYIKPEILALKKAGHDPALYLDALEMGKKEGEDDAL